MASFVPAAEGKILAVNGENPSKSDGRRNFFPYEPLKKCLFLKMSSEGRILRAKNGA
jgi:hypothetical protein